jgi:hypothetical protein
MKYLSCALVVTRGGCSEKIFQWYWSAGHVRLLSEREIDDAAWRICVGEEMGVV